MSTSLESKERKPCIELSAVPASRRIEVGLLTGGYDRPYVFGLATALQTAGVYVEVVGGDDVDRPEFHTLPRLKFLNLRGDQDPQASFAKKVIRVLVYYARLARYAFNAEPGIFHILWHNKFLLFDRTLLMLYYRFRGKKIALTAHNVNAGKRDTNDSMLNRISLRVQYRLADHIFVHTDRMKEQLLAEFGVCERAVTVVPFGINNSVANTGLTRAQAKQRFGLTCGDRVILFFGNIASYKGLEFLVRAFQHIGSKSQEYRLIIAGRPHKDAEEYLETVQQLILESPIRDRVTQRIEYIPDEETEIYFKAADVVVLPYTYVFQSGVLFLAYSFGAPVIATKVGSLEEDIIESETGFLCRPCDWMDLARAIETYFRSDLFNNLETRSKNIAEFANRRNSWDIVGQETRRVYAEVLGVISGTGVQ